MPVFDITGPDGRTYEIEGATAEGALAALKKHVGGSSAPQSETIEAPTYDAMGNPTQSVTTQPVTASMPYRDQMARVGQFTDNMVRAAANGATFGLADKFAGGMNAVTGQAPSYDAGVKAERARTAEMPSAMRTVGEVGGGVLTGTGLARSGITLAGRFGPSLLGRALGFGMEGAAYGAAHGAGNTYSSRLDDYIEAAKNGGATGFGIGAALPVVGTAAAGAYRTGAAFMGPRVGNLGPGASAMLRGAAQADEAGIRNLSRMGDEAMLPDAGPAMLGLGQGAGTGVGEGRSMMVNALRARDQNTGQRLARTLDETLGPAPIPSRVERGLRENRQALSPEYEAAFQNARAVDTPAIAGRIESMIPNARGEARAALQRVYDDLHIIDAQGRTRTLDPHPRALFETRRAIDGIVGETQNANVQRVLGDVRRMVDEELAAKVPGIKLADAKYADSMRQSEALQRGADIFDGGKTAIRPAELVDELRAAGAPSGVQVGPSPAPLRLRQGARAELDRIVGTNVNDLNALERKLGTPQDWNNQKLGITFGDAARDRIVDALTGNRQFRQTFQDIVQNSQSAQRLSSAKAMEGSPGGNVDGGTTMTGIGLKAVNKLAKVAMGAANANTKDQIGRVMSLQGEDARRIARMLLQSAQQTGANAATIDRVLSSRGLLYGLNAPAAGRTGTQR